MTTIDDRDTDRRDKQRRQESRTGFLLGLVLVLTLLFVALEWNSGGSVQTEVDEDNTDMMEDLSLMPDVDKPAPQVAPEQQKPEEQADRLKAVDDLQKQIDQLQPSLSALLSTDMKLTPEELAEIKPKPMVPPGAETEENPLDKLPEFPGGMSGYIQWLTKNLHYPPQAQQQRQQGTAMVSFIVSAEGRTSSIKLESSSGNSLLDREALRVINLMPQWKPGTYRGRPSRYMIAVPVTFKL